MITEEKQKRYCWTRTHPSGVNFLKASNDKAKQSNWDFMKKKVKKKGSGKQLKMVKHIEAIKTAISSQHCILTSKSSYFLTSFSIH